MTSPIDLELIKDDLGITSDENDEFLQRRIDGIWNRIEGYTNRIMRAPAATFRDTWSAVSVPNTYGHVPPYLDSPTPIIYLRQYPVTEVTEYEAAGEEGDAALVLVDKPSGKLLGLDGTVNHFWWPMPFSSGAVITYKAGWDELPTELYEIVLSIMGPMWTARQSSVAGTLGPLTSISINDVGSLDFSAPKTAAGDDPVLGPYSAILNKYVRYPLATGVEQASELVAEGS